MKKITYFLFIIVFIGISIGITSVKLFLHPASNKQVLSVQQENHPSSSPTSSQSLHTQSDTGIPHTLSIPRIKVRTTIESVGLDSQKRMAVPQNSDDVGWYDLGYRPGEVGSAVIDGHLDKVTGAPAVFWNVAKLSRGDKIIVTNSNGKNYTFSVIRSAEYPYNNFPIQEVFGVASVPMLNLITCNGSWDNIAKNYSQRTVIYSQLVK